MRRASYGAGAPGLHFYTLNKTRLDDRSAEETSPSSGAGSAAPAAVEIDVSASS